MICVDKKILAFTGAASEFVTLIKSYDSRNKKSKVLNASKLKEIIKKSVDVYFKRNDNQINEIGKYNLLSFYSRGLGHLKKDSSIELSTSAIIFENLLKELEKEPLKKEKEKTKKEAEQKQPTTDNIDDSSAHIVSVDDEVQGSEIRILDVEFTEGNKEGLVRLEEEIDSKLQPDELIRKISSLRFNNDSQLHKEFYLYLKKTLFNNLIFDYSDTFNVRIVYDYEIDGNINALLEVNKDYEGNIQPIVEDPDFSVETFSSLAERLDYFNYIIAKDFDALIRAYPSIRSLIGKNKEGQYVRKLDSTIRDNGFDQGTINFDDEATNLFKFVVDIIQDSNGNFIRYEDLITGSIKLSSTLEREHPFQEFIASAKSGILKNGMTSSEGKAVKAFAEYVDGINNTVDPNAIVFASEMVRIAMTPSALTLGFEKIIDGGMKFMLESEKSKGTESKLNEDAVNIVATFGPILYNSVKDSTDPNFKIKQIIVKYLSKGLSVEEVLDKKGYASKGKKKYREMFNKAVDGYVDYTVFMSKLLGLNLNNKTNALKEIDKIVEEYSDKLNISIDNKDILDFLESKSLDPSAFRTSLDNVYTPVKLVGTNFVEYVKAIAEILDNAELNAQRMVQKEVTGNLSARNTLHNVISDIPSKRERVTKSKNPLFNHNIFATALVKNNFKRSGVEGFTMNKSHTMMTHTDNAISQFIYEFAATLKDGISYFTPTTYEAKNTEYGFGVLRNSIIEIGGEKYNPFNNDISEKGIEETKRFLYNSNVNYYQEVKQNILKDISTLLGTEISTLEEIPQDIKNLSIELNNERIQAGFDPVLITNGIHYNNFALLEAFKKFEGGSDFKNLYQEAKTSFAKYLVDNKIGFKNELMSDLLDEDIEKGQLFTPAATFEDGEYKLSTIAEKFFWEWNVVHDHFEQFTSGVSEQYNKGAEHKNVTEQIKRNGTVVATVHPYMQGLEDGVAEMDKFVIINDPSIPYRTATGDVHKPDIFDGAGLSTMISMLEKERSLGNEYGQNVGRHHKSVNNGMNESNGVTVIEKWNDFALTHEFLRNSVNYGTDEQPFDFVSIHNKLLSTIKFSYTYDNPRGIPALRYDPITNTVVQTKLRGNKAYTNMLEMYNDLGGIYAVVETTKEEADIESNGKFYRYVTIKDKEHPATIIHTLKTKHFNDTLKGKTGLDKNLNQYTLAEIKKFGTEIKEAKRESIKEKHISTAAFESAVKSGRSNVMTLEQVEQMENLVYTLHSTKNRGVQVNTEKELEDKQLSASTQAYSAVAFGGFDNEVVKDIYEVLEILSLNKLEEELKTVFSKSTFSEKDVKTLRKIASEKIQQALTSRNSISSMADAIIGEFSGRLDKLPVDSKQLFGVVSSTLNSYLTNEGIRSKMSGSQYVIRPAHHINTIGNTVVGTNKDFDYLVSYLSKFKDLKELNDEAFVFTNIADLFTSTENIREQLIARLKTRRLSPAKVYYYENKVKIDIHDHPNVVKIRQLNQSLKTESLNGEQKSLIKAEIKQLDLGLEQFLKDLTKKAKHDGNGNYTIGDKLVLTSEAGEVIVPFAAFKKYQKYGINKNMSLQQVRRILQEAPIEVLESFEAQLESLTMRIPLQSLASVMFNKAVGFHNDDPTTIQISDAHQNLTGGDFDVDKSNYNKFFVNDEGILEIWFDDDLFGDRSQWNIPAQEVKQKLIEGKVTTEGAINYALYKMMTLSSLPSTIQMRETAINTNNIDEVVEMSPKKDMDKKMLKNDPSTFWRKKEGNMVTKQTVGVFATAIKALAAVHYSFNEGLKQIKAFIDAKNFEAAEELASYMNIPPIYLNGKEYRTVANLNYDEITTLIKESGEVTEDLNNTYKVLSSVVNSGISAEELKSKINDLNLKPKSYDLLGEFLNAAVDGAKDPKLDKINSDISVSSIYAFGSAIGIPVQEIGRLMTNPIIDAVIVTASKSPFSKESFRAIDSVAKDIISVIELLTKPFDNQKGVEPGDPPRTFKTLLIEKVNQINEIRKKENKSLGKDEEPKKYITLTPSDFSVIQNSINGSIKKRAANITKALNITKDDTKEVITEKVNAAVAKAKIDNTFSNQRLKQIVSSIYNYVQDTRTNKIQPSSKPNFKRDLDRLTYNLYLNSNFIVLNSPKIKDYLDTIKSSEIINSTEESLKVLNDFVKLYQASKPFKILGQTLGINQGLGSNEYKIFAFKRRVESLINKVEKETEDYEKHPVLLEKFNMINFLQSMEVDGSYHKDWINAYKDVVQPQVGGVNMLWIFATNPYYRGQFNILLKSDQWGKSISYKLNQMDQLIDWLEDNKIIYKNDIKESDIKRIFNVIDEIAFDKYLDTANIEIPINRKDEVRVYQNGRYQAVVKDKLNLSNNTDRSVFIEWMNSIVLPSLVFQASDSNSNLYNNQFLKKLVYNLTRPDAFGRRSLKWKLMFDPTNIQTELRLIEQESIRKGLQQLADGTFKIGGIEYDIIKLLTLYNRLLNQDGSTSESFTQYLSNFESTKEINKNFFETLSGFKNNLDVITYLNQNRENLPMLLGKYNLVKFIPEALEDLQGENYNLYVTYSDGKKVISYNGQTYIPATESPIVSLPQLEGTALTEAIPTELKKVQKLNEFINKLIENNIITDC